MALQPLALLVHGSLFLSPMRPIASPLHGARDHGGRIYCAQPTPIMPPVFKRPGAPISAKGVSDDSGSGSLLHLLQKLDSNRFVLGLIV